MTQLAPLAGSPERTWPAPIAGAAAGIITVLSFAILHHVLISNIWFSIIPMLIAGAACGASLAWTYELLFTSASLITWAGFVGVHTLLVLLLGAASVVIFDPIVPIAVVIAANEPPTALIKQALPLTGLFTLIVAALISALWGRSLAKFGANLLASAILVTFLGLNVSTLGLVEMSAGSSGVVIEFLGLTAVIMIGYGLAFALLDRRRFQAEDGAGKAG